MSLWMGMALAVAVGAQETTPDEASEPAAAVEAEIEEITVWGQHAVRQARAAVIRDMESLGYKAKDRDGDVVFRPPERWMGRVTFTRDGQLGFGRVVVAMRSAQMHARTYDPGTSVDAADARATSASLDVSSTADDLAFDRGSEAQLVVPEVATWVLPSKRVLGELQLRVLKVVEPSVSTYRQVLWATDVRDTMATLADRLDALWRDGVSLEGGATVVSPEERRAAVLDYWATRASTKEGRLVCDAVALWLRETVQDSAHPAGTAEIAEAEARRSDGATFGVR